MRLSLSLAAALLATGSAHASGPKGPAGARTDPPRTIISDADYPEAALRAGEEGTVEYEVLIGATGRVERCSILVSSGSAALDSETCRIMQARARFAPARDAGGRPTSDSKRSRMEWRIPR